MKMKSNQYDSIAEDYDSLFVDEKSIRENREISQMLRNLKRPILDIGCGTGLLIDLLNIPKRGYMGIDPSSKMLGVFRRKHPDHKVINIPFEWLRVSAISYHTAVALFGSASYIRENCLRRIPKSRRMFLMFYKENYHPVTYERTGQELKHYSYTRRKLRKIFSSCRVNEFGNYYIVTNL